MSSDSNLPQEMPAKRENRATSWCRVPTRHSSCCANVLSTATYKTCYQDDKQCVRDRHIGEWLPQFLVQCFFRVSQFLQTNEHWNDTAASFTRSKEAQIQSHLTLRNVVVGRSRDSTLKQSTTTSFQVVLTTIPMSSDGNYPAQLTHRSQIKQSFITRQAEWNYNRFSLIVKQFTASALARHVTSNTKSSQKTIYPP
jgi:hypothetical protein